MRLGPKSRHSELWIVYSWSAQGVSIVLTLKYPSVTFKNTCCTELLHFVKGVNQSLITISAGYEGWIWKWIFEGCPLIGV